VSTAFAVVLRFLLIRLPLVGIHGRDYIILSPLELLDRLARLRLHQAARQTTMADGRWRGNYPESCVVSPCWQLQTYFSTCVVPEWTQPQSRNADNQIEWPETERSSGTPKLYAAGTGFRCARSR